MNVKLTLNVKPPNEEKAKEAVKQAVEKRKAASETIEEAWERVGGLSLNDKERQLYVIAKEAFFDGAVGRLHPDKKLSKGEVLSMGTIIQRQHDAGLREERITQVLASKPSNFHILTDDSQLPHFIRRVALEVNRQKAEWTDRFKILGIESMAAGDFEGTGVDTYVDLSIGFSIWLPLLDEGYYLPYGHVSGFDVPHAFRDDDPQLTRSKVIETVKPYLTSPRQGKTFHMGSARYDLHIAMNDGYEIRGCVWDTLDAMHLLNEHEEAYGLKPLTQKYGKCFGVQGDVFTFEDLFGNRSPAPFNTELVGIYAIKDVYYGWKFFEWQFETMKKTNRLLECYVNIDSNLPETDVLMGRCGFVIDLEEMKRLEKEFDPKIEESKAKVFEAYNIDRDFVERMDRKLNEKKINDWIAAQKKRIAKRDENIEKQRKIIADYEKKGKTHLKAFKDAVDRLRKYESEELAEPTVENAPMFIEEFSLTNDNHIGYLIYDHVGIEDRTGVVKRGKKRSVAADVLSMYYEDEESLKPLATVAAYEKLLNTYVKKIPEALEVDGRLHSEFKAGGTATGRYSSSGYSGRPLDVLAEFEEVKS